MKLISASRTQFLYLVLTICVLAFSVAMVHFWPLIHDYYWMTVGGAKLHKELGFSTGLVRATWDGQRASEFPAITEVVPDGVLGRAGVRPGMMPAFWCSSSINLAAFYHSLEESRGRSLTLRLVPAGQCELVRQGTAITITINVPPS